MEKFGNKMHKYKKTLHFCLLFSHIFLVIIFFVVHFGTLCLANNNVFIGSKNPVRRSFSKEEDKTLIKLVEKYGEKWDRVSSNMPERNIRQCRERWKFYLDPKIDRSPWTLEEDKLIISKYYEFGFKISKVRKFIGKKRTNQQIRNRIRKLICSDNFISNKNETPLNNENEVVQNLVLQNNQISVTKDSYDFQNLQLSLSQYMPVLEIKNQDEEEYILPEVDFRSSTSFDVDTIIWDINQ